MAEVDYVVNIDSNIFPIDVKAGKTGKLKSLQVFCQEYNSPFGIRTSMHQLELKNNTLSIPLYMINELPRIVRETL